MTRRTPFQLTVDLLCAGAAAYNWTEFGANNGPLPQWAYALAGALCLAGLLAYWS